MSRDSALLVVLTSLLACSSPGSGSSVVDRGACDALIICASELAPDSRDEFIASYGAGGSCWTGGPTQWAACRDACHDSLEALNLVGQATGQSCGDCQTDADCSSFGAQAYCEAGLCLGGDSSGGSAGEGETGAQSETGDTGDTGGGCEPLFEVPPECLQLVRCVGSLAPEEAAAAEAQYGAEGSCWCGTAQEAEACLLDCVEQVTNAIEQYPTVGACHEVYCTLDQLDPDQPYGPPVEGACPSWNGAPQLPLEQPLGLPGSYCAPPCQGLADACPDHSQTGADGTCYLIVNDTNYCASVCYVDPTHVGGAQCQCGATCQPTTTDGQGVLRGICTFE